MLKHFLIALALLLITAGISLSSFVTGLKLIEHDRSLQVCRRNFFSLSFLQGESGNEKA
jgi:hypothetical protein